MESTQKPTIAILATGGTIAGLMDSHTTHCGVDSHTLEYKAGMLDIDLLIRALPQEIHTIASLHTEQIANIDSADMSAEIWLTLAKRVDTLLQSAHIRFCKII